MKPVQLAESIYWVGGIDWNLRNFHGYLTQRGSTYNAYLIIDEKITLIDTVKHYLTDELFERVSQVVDPAKIDYVVANHVEMDHSGGLPAVLEKAPNATLFTSPNGEKGLKEHFKNNWNFKAVKNGETLSLGKHSLAFTHTPMVHWPDNMVTWCPEEKILFSNDAFGQHIASAERFDDEYPLETILAEAMKYYANIVLPYGAQVQKALEALAGLPIRLIAPSHGIAWRAHVPEILKRYQAWSANITGRKAVIVYDTMWDSTAKMAAAIRSGFEEKDVPVVMASLQHNHMSDIMTEIMTAQYVCVGSPTLNNNLLPTVAAFLTYMKGLAPKNRIGLAFGSYGWGGQSIEQVNDVLKECGWTMMNPLKVKYIPSQDDLSSVRETVIKAIT
ncbi:MAG: MBL fold metallo-hydrolase [Candidatus Raymondbacteria bacterium RifOxyA12_full_50_37]|uniref:MBL fold metallo-hydrolase n=1 Tax=Candidatus Raymondbacteria bacterium RIFOXYD12_FULL_49_13 TaxID=1817890 RepID=A0A1F7FK55_UNCRA|nr:MAG: MBL fold metallo-hydrolase [Candidatus Raymondbacteria bacterium RifOxyA12_full_50_37]OGJ94537.1 MAG: MBL fold metallo-hydrolase [Candidatus Raymondbacteria bacterium RIFOXYA2_FULL_49_16]OGJ98512.1 MAG: MBL fold metallo-hydrolase [Candidatus Raymondbacteria bacterium RifOxyC12_full_50_8]OGK01686.1 MAG: MBL fold metallo-hydrolase [Candidatus Raymondbacteria bacterium RifOxyB12_full_50_8]OGK07013.1 MAG: MBL fold metallo-hydrolase [Candidatus Raymondbacteria bacterium RIFOXYD12_FULL_49_13]